MKLVLNYVLGDGCTYWCERTLPVEYESAEALIVDFENAARAAYSSKEWDFVFVSHTFCASHFYENDDYICPEIMTVDEWFDRPS